MELNDLSETAQSGIQQIVADHKAGQAETNRNINRAIWIFLLMAVVSISANIYIQQRIERRINQPDEPVVALAVLPKVENPTICPGDTLDYQLTITIHAPSVVDIDTIVRNLDTGRTEWYGATTRNIYDTPGELVTQSQWMLPLLQPATLSRPERPWTAGQYRRNVAVTGVEGLKESSVINVDFRIGAHCPGVIGG